MIRLSRSGECRVTHRRPVEDVKREGWVDEGTLVISVLDPDLTWPERELVDQLGTKKYGKTKVRGE